MSDFLRDSAALSLQVASPDSLEPLLRAGAVTRSTASRWRSRGEGPIGRVTAILWHLAEQREAQATAISRHFDGVVRHAVAGREIADDVDMVFEAHNAVVKAYHGLKRSSFGLAALPVSKHQIRAVRKAALSLAALADELAITAGQVELGVRVPSQNSP